MSFLDIFEKNVCYFANLLKTVKWATHQKNQSILYVHATFCGSPITHMSHTCLLPWTDLHELELRNSKSKKSICVSLLSSTCHLPLASRKLIMFYYFSTSINSFTSSLIKWKWRDRFFLSLILRLKKRVKPWMGCKRYFTLGRFIL